MTPEQIAALPGLVAEATEGPWSKHGNGQQILGNGRLICTMLHGAQSKVDSRLIALAPDLAATVIEQQRIITALSEDASKAAELAAENERLRKLASPEWFYPPEAYESDQCHHSVGEVIEEWYFWDRTKTGQHVFEINAATSLPSIWVAVSFNCTCADPEDCECDNVMTVTEHSSASDARAALNGGKP